MTRRGALRTRSWRRAVVGGTASTVTLVTRDLASAAGGATLVVVGTGFSGTPRVYFRGPLGDVQSPLVGAVTNPNLVAFIVPACPGTPAKTGTPYDIYVEDKLLTPATFRYMPAKTVSYFPRRDFEDGLISPMGTNITVGTVAASAIWAKNGTKSCRCNATGSFAGGGAGLTMPFDGRANTGTVKNAPAVSNGLYLRWWVLVPSATVADLTAGLSHQMKLLLQRVGGSQPPFGGHQLGYGDDFPGGNEMTDQDDGSTGGLFQYRSGRVLGDNVWIEVIAFMYRDTVAHTGTLALWLSDPTLGGSCKLVGSIFTHANIGTDSLLSQFDPWVGAVYMESTGNVDAYVDDVEAADGCIDP